ncbi:type IV secretory system conjugative DNA transfer family protein [Streptomyces sp. NPDC002324]
MDEVSSTSKRRGPGRDLSGPVMVGAASAAFLAVGMAWTSAAAGAALTGATAPPANPFALLFNLAQGTYRWPGAWSTAVLVAELVALAAVAVLIVRAVRRASARRKPIDAAARHMGKGRDLDKISERTVLAKADRLGVAEGVAPGVYLGRSVIGRQPLYGSAEDTYLAIWGTRSGKTTTLAIPAVMRHGQAPVLCTTNRRDLVDATRLPRSRVGEVWVADFQGLLGEEPSWFWDPLTYVTDMTKAARLASHFAADTRAPGAQTDAYFDPAGEELVANMLLAARLDNRPITQVYRWLSNQRDDEPYLILEEAGPDYRAAAEGLHSVLNAADKQRSGVYGTAMKNVACLRDPKVTRWVTPPDEGNLTKRRAFRPEKYVRSTDTLYLVSREGTGSAGALVTALTVAICEAAEEFAMQSPNGRLARPLLPVLDEAANICKWNDLPDMYSHYGSRGINLMTILQSWAQGVTVWGEYGMEKLWATANVTSYGGGGRDDRFFSRISALVGQFEPLTYSKSRQPGGHSSNPFASNVSTTIGSRQEEILSAADLAAVPSGRAVLFVSQTRTTLVETKPWFEYDWAPEVTASLNKYDPGATP